jgi:hypothetical protein
VDDELADAVESLRREHRLALDVDERTITLVEAVKGDPGHAVLRVLGVAERASPVGAAAYGAAGVAAGVWSGPELYLARWTKGRRWVVGYRLTGGSTPNHYVRTEGRIPTRMEIGNWYTSVPDDVHKAFTHAGLSLDERPFAEVDVPGADLPPPPPPRTPRPARAPRQPAIPRAPRAARPSKPAAPKARTEATRLCPSCQMQKSAGQFVAGSDLCVDCR